MKFKAPNKYKSALLC